MTSKRILLGRERASEEGGEFVQERKPTDVLAVMKSYETYSVTSHLEIELGGAVEYLAFRLLAGCLEEILHPQFP